MARQSGSRRWKKNGEIIGQGGQGQIFVVEDLQGEHEGTYALKVLTNPKRRLRLDNEILSTRALYAQGAPVLEVLDDYLISSPDDERAWYVTPIFKNGNLGDWLAINCKRRSNNVPQRR